MIFEKVARGKKLSCFVKAHEDVFLKPNSEVMIWGDVNASLTPGAGIISCSSVMLQLGLFVASTVISVTEKTHRVPVTLLNPSSHEKVVKKDTTIAQVRLLQPGERLHEASVNTAANTSNVTASSKKDKIPSDFRTMFKIDESVFTDGQKEQLMQLLWEYEDIFAQP